MTAVPDKVLNWLYSVLTSEYHDVNRTYNAVAQTLAAYPSLSPRTEVYTDDHGTSALLLLLSGTLPVQFRGTVYRFPVQLWVPHAYPTQPPIAFVTPSKDMMLRPGQQHVGMDGKIYHPYLAQWGRYSSILDFLGVLCGVFAKEPPVMSKQQQQQQYAPQAQPTPPPPPELPAELRRPAQVPSPAQQRSGGPPPLPPKPGQEPVRQSPAIDSRQSGLRQNGPPLPPLPPQVAQLRQQSPACQWNQNSGPGQPPPLPLQPYPQQRQSWGNRAPQPPLQTPQHQPYQQQHELESPVSPISPPEGQIQRSFSQRYQQPPPFPQQQPQYSQQPQPAPQGIHSQYAPQGLPYPYQQPPLQQKPAPKPAQPLPNLLDSDLDVSLPSQKSNAVPPPVPVVPPNPEKDHLLQTISSSLRSQIITALESNRNALPALQAQNSALQTAYQKLQNELNELQQLDAALSTNERILHETMREADRVIDSCKGRKAPDVDEVLVAPTVVGGQLWNLVADERALEDARVELGRALDRGRCEGMVFVKQTRSLAREQFLKKALIKKIAKGMGLDEEGYSRGDESFY